MSYKLYLWSFADAVEQSQAVWRVNNRVVSLEECEREMVHPVIMRSLPKTGLIVEAGCGHGKWPIYLQRRGYRMVGIEISRDACMIAKENEPGANVAQGDVRRVPLKSGSVDAVLSLGVVEHNEAGPLDALHETRRILKPGGVLILTVPYDNLFRRLVANHLMNYVNWRRRRANAELKFAEYRFNKREVAGFLAQTGFEVVSAHPNDAVPPWNAGLWVDYINLTTGPFKPPTMELFRFPGIRGKIADLLLHRVPWLVCAEVAFVARAR